MRDSRILTKSGGKTRLLDSFDNCNVIFAIGIGKQVRTHAKFGDETRIRFGNLAFAPFDADLVHVRMCACLATYGDDACL